MTSSQGPRLLLKGLCLMVQCTIFVYTHISSLKKLFIIAKKKKKAPLLYVLRYETYIIPYMSWPNLRMKWPLWSWVSDVLYNII